MLVIFFGGRWRKGDKMLIVLLRGEPRKKYLLLLLLFNEYQNKEIVNCFVSKKKDKFNGWLLSSAKTRKEIIYHC